MVNKCHYNLYLSLLEILILKLTAGHENKTRKTSVINKERIFLLGNTNLLRTFLDYLFDISWE